MGEDEPAFNPQEGGKSPEEQEERVYAELRKKLEATIDELDNISNRLGSLTPEQRHQDTELHNLYDQAHRKLMKAIEDWLAFVKNHELQS